MSATNVHVSQFIPLSDAAMRLQVPYRRVYDMALSGLLGRPERRGQRLWVPEDAVAAQVASSTEPAR